MVRPTGFEPVAPRLGIWCSILLSYGRTAKRQHSISSKTDGDQSARARILPPFEAKPGPKRKSAEDVITLG